MSTIGDDEDSPAAHGPFHRTGSMQPDDVTHQQLATGELWGKPNRGSDVSSVDAWVGPLPLDRHGIEFYTDVAPSPGSPPGKARWLGPRPGVVIEDGWAKISGTITKYRPLGQP